MADVALLTPVPLEHLQSGLGKQAATGRAEFSTNTGTLKKLLQLLKGETADVYIYASGAGQKYTVTWRARFLGISNRENSEYRPNSTETDTPSEMYYDVSDLRPLPENEWIPISRFSGHGKEGHYASNFTPKRPMLVAPISD